MDYGGREMIKLLLYIVIIGSGAGIGYLKARPYENRILHLEDLITALQILESEMKYRKDPLPILLKRIGDLNIGKSSLFFMQVIKGLKEDYSFDFYKSWISAVEKVYEDSSLTERDKELLSEVGLDLGKTDINSQKNTFTRTYTRLEQQLAEALEEKKTKGKMYNALGVAIGVLIVIVLI
jgi:stage III sporulation protein AB